MGGMPTLLVENVTKEFPTRGEPLVVLRGISLELNAGDMVTITFFSCVMRLQPRAGLLRPQWGLNTSPPNTTWS